ncbi:MAG: hypothetical protein JXB04_06455 [Kiritimatiellae bacterium]|nr:hypothetical protein [Kiritimatiellia bacterium]
MSGRGRGCLSGCLVVILLVALLAAGAWLFLRRYVIENFLARMERQGYHVVREQFIEVREPVQEPTVYYGQTVRLGGGSERGVAIVARTAEVAGHFKGNVRFFGQALTVERGALIDYDLHAFAQVISLYGRVEGEVTGVHLELNR